MHRIDLPAGSTVRMTATARPNFGIHRWGIRLFTASDTEPNAPSRLNYGSQIGGRDCEQRIDVPPQDKDCRIEVTCGHSIAGGWQDRQGSVEDDTPGLLVIGFFDPSSSVSQTADVVLSFAFADAKQLEASE